jgi:hypothetical protein
VVPGGGLSPNHQHWIATAINFFLPVLVLSRVFSGKFVAGLRRAFRTRQLVFHGECLPLAEEQAFRAFLDSLREQDWVVYAKPPFGGPEHMLHYLARYTHRVAISNHRIVAVNASQVLFRWKDYAHHSKQRTMPLTCRRISAPLRAARPPERVSAHPLLRLAGQSPTQQTASALSRSSPAPSAANLSRACICILAMPTLPCAHGGPGTIHPHRAS